MNCPWLPEAHPVLGSKAHQCQCMKNSTMRRGQGWMAWARTLEVVLLRHPEEITWGNILLLFIIRRKKKWFPVIKQIDVYLLRQKCWVEFLKFQTWSFLCLCQSCFIFSLSLHLHLLFLTVLTRLLPSFPGFPGWSDTQAIGCQALPTALTREAVSPNWLRSW